MIVNRVNLKKTSPLLFSDRRMVIRRDHCSTVLYLFIFPMSVLYTWWYCFLLVATVMSCYCNVWNFEFRLHIRKSIFCDLAKPILLLILKMHNNIIILLYYDVIMLIMNYDSCHLVFLRRIFSIFWSCLNFYV